MSFSILTCRPYYHLAARGAAFGLLLSACADLSQIGRAPSFSDNAASYEHHAIYSSPMPISADPSGASDASSLWTGGTNSLLGDRRAARRGDIVTVVIEIDDKAEFSSSSARSRNSNMNTAIPQMLGLPQRIDKSLPSGASLANAIDSSAQTRFSGQGDISRSEQLTLRVAATVVEELPNGVLRIQGQQEVRVNFELRELTISGYLRPSDISRRNEVAYDKIAGAKIAYGGRGQISQVQQPAYGQQITDILSPF